MLPVYSNEGKAALPVLARNAYKIFVYFEDEGEESLYEKIIERLGFNLSDVRVICLKGKGSLLAQRELIASLPSKDNTFYVLDKDFDDLLDLKVVCENIYYLERYSIENYFIEHEALVEIASEEKPKQKNVLAAALDLSAYTATEFRKMERLVSLYLIAQEFNLPIANSSESIQVRATDLKPWLLCENKIELYANEISALLILTGSVKTESELNELFLSRHRKINVTYDAPGKQLVDLLRFFIFHKIGSRHPSKESFCYRLATKCKFNSLIPLQVALKNRVA